MKWTCLLDCLNGTRITVYYKHEMMLVKEIPCHIGIITSVLNFNRATAEHLQHNLSWTFISYILYIKGTKTKHYQLVTTAFVSLLRHYKYFLEHQYKKKINIVRLKVFCGWLHLFLSHPMTTFPTLVQSFNRQPPICSLFHLSHTEGSGPTHTQWG